MRSKLFRHPILLLPFSLLILFWPVLIQPFYLLYPTFSDFSDIMVIHWPKAHLLAQSWQAGQGLPLWTPLILSGMPLAANQLAMLFYPPAWLFLVLPLEPTFNLLFFGHFLWGGIGMYLLLRRGHHLSPGAALLGSLTFALNGKWLAHAAGGHVSMVAAVAWIPWALFGLMKLLQSLGGGSPEPGPSSPLSGRLRIGWAMLVGLAVAMQIVTHTLPVIYTTYMLGAMALWPALTTYWQQRDRLPSRSSIRLLLLSLGFLAVSLILAGSLGAVQLLPLLELAQYSNRSLSLAEATAYSVTPLGLFVGLLLPTPRAGHELIIYLGLIPLCLLPFGLARSRPWSWFYGGLLLFTLLFALGPLTPLHSLFYYFAPGFRWVRTPARIFLVGAIAVAALAAFGVERLMRAQWPAAVQKRLTLLFVGGGMLAFLLGSGLALMVEEVRLAGIALAIFGPVGLGLLLLRIRGFLSAPLAMTLLGIALALDLGLFGLSLMRFVPPATALAPGQAAAEYLAQRPGLFRIYSPSYSLPMQTAAAHGLHLADGVEPVHLARYDQYMARAGGYQEPGFTVTIPPFSNGPPESALAGVKPNLKLLGLLNVQYLAAAFPMEWPELRLEEKIGGTYIYTNEQALPRAWVAHQSRPLAENWLDQLEALAEPGQVVLLDPALPQVDLSLAAGPVEITGYAADLITMETELQAPGWLVLSEIWYPGWQARVNGEPVPVERVNGLLRGIYLAQVGQVEITMAYQPRSVSWGGWISGITGVGLLLGAVVLFLKR